MGDLTGHAGGTSSASATIGAAHAGTGLEVTLDDDGAEVQGWATAPLRESLLGHPVALRVEKAIANVPLLNAISTTCFRGIRFHPAFTPTARDMGPPKPEQTDDDGRYNRKGEPALYLCVSDSAVPRERPPKILPDGRVLWIQKYRLPTCELRIADLGLPGSRGLVSSLMWFAELSGVAGYPSAVFSQTVSEIVARYFDGMIYAGVQGEATLRYQNVVVFRPHPRWPEWLEPESQPYRVTD